MHPFVIAALLGTTLAQAPTGQADSQACAQRCADALNGCRSQPGANQDTCMTQYATCLGYNPGPNVTPTACGNNSPAPTNNQGGGRPDACAQKCIDAYNGCRGQPGANQSTCRSEFAGCLGYNPPNDTPMNCQQGNSMSWASNTWQSNTWPTSTWPATATSTGLIVQDQCAKKCTDEMNACRSQPGANQSTCASEYANCLGYSPYGPNGFTTPSACGTGGVAPTGPIVAGGSQLSPAYAAMAIGVLALL
ncbi:hypothetical protein QQS21_004402 [Conoideocrella luteorostrata]|uniref:Uncharacterized protein n=1 Tax=Conoideocrella luteorostrata TaxID=1105319 RepID=A0AAJ0CSG7_9HYPO|nr:hypothetical protein QQS21_004402 [Conoideocrella luteorostrata]